MVYFVQGSELTLEVSCHNPTFIGGKREKY